MLDILSYGFMQRALLGGIAIALITSLIGPFLVLRRLSLLGDGLSHLAFGGVALGLLLHYNPFIVALIFVVLGSLVIRYLMTKNIYGDAVIALILSFGVGLGIIVTGVVRGFNVDLFSFLIGSILTLSITDIFLIIGILIITLIFIFVYYKKLLYMTFNEELAQLHQKNYAIMGILFTLVVALAVMVSVRAVGILLVSALLVIPTLISLQLSTSFRSTILIGVIASVIAMVVGIFSSFSLDVPPSGMIVMILFVIFFIVSLKPTKNFVRSIVKKS